MLRLAGMILLLATLAAAPVRAGLFSKQATSVAEVHGTARPMSVASPDDGLRAVARYMNGKLTVFAGIHGFDFAGGADAELLWAPDSNALAVTSNSEEGDGHFLATVLVRKTPRKWQRIDLTRRIARLLPAPRGCADPAKPDVAAIGWTSERRLIVAATRPPAKCDRHPGFTAFIVDVPSGDVLMSIDQRDARRRYRRMFGKALSGEAWRCDGEHRGCSLPRSN